MSPVRRERSARLQNKAAASRSCWSKFRASDPGRTATMPGIMAQAPGLPEDLVEVMHSGRLYG
jgi:hypothetical protein